jgi:hypothetical protein
MKLNRHPAKPLLAFYRYTHFLGGRMAKEFFLGFRLANLVVVLFLTAILIQITYQLG